MAPKGGGSVGSRKEGFFHEWVEGYRSRRRLPPGTDRAGGRAALADGDRGARRDHPVLGHAPPRAPARVVGGTRAPAGAARAPDRSGPGPDRPPVAAPA